MHFDGSGARRLTNPQNCLRTVGKANPPAGDFDPKLSPDGSRVVFMRHVSAFSFATLLVDVATGKEQELSPNLSPDAADAVPEWSADGKTILFWRIDRSKLSDCGIWKMTADGRYRQRIPLPRGYFYTMPAFFPGESALPNSEIIFSGHRQFGL